VGTLFKAAREAQRLSQYQVAALTRGRPGEVSRTLISAIERGRSLPGLETLVSLSRVLNIEPMEVVERVDVGMSEPVDLSGLSTQEMLEFGRECLRSRRHREAITVFDSLAERLLAEPPEGEREALAMRARVESNRALALRHCGALRAAQSSAQRAVELSRDDPEGLANAYMILASVLSFEGLHTLARDAARRAVELTRELGPARQCQAWNQYGSVLQLAGRPEEARQAFVRALGLAVRAQDLHHRIKVEGNIGTCLTDLGRKRQARARFAKAVRLARNCGDGAAEAFWLIELGRVAFDQGRLDEAEECGHAALGRIAPDGEPLTIFRAQWLLHRIVRVRDPRAPDRQRLAQLRRLWSRLEAHRGLDVVVEFEQAVIEPARRKRSEEQHEP
jgi:tetratricopeptide (TPR) repeat protein